MTLTGRNLIPTVVSCTFFAADYFMIAKWQLPTALSFMGVLTLMANFQWLNRPHWCFSIFAVRIDARFVRLYVSLVYLTSCGLFIVGWLKEYWIYKLSLLKGCDNLFPDSQKFAAFESVGYVFVCLLCNVLSQRRNWNWNLDLMKLCTNVKLIKGNSHFNETPWRSVIYLSFTCILVQVGYLYCYTPLPAPSFEGYLNRLSMLRARRQATLERLQSLLSQLLFFFRVKLAALQLQYHLEETIDELEELGFEGQLLLVILNATNAEVRRFVVRCNQAMTATQNRIFDMFLRRVPWLSAYITQSRERRRWVQSLLCFGSNNLWDQPQCAKRIQLSEWVS